MARPSRELERARPGNAAPLRGPDRVRARRASGELPHLPLHAVLVTAVVVTLYPILWVSRSPSPAGRTSPSPTCRRRRPSSTGSAP